MKNHEEYRSSIDQKAAEIFKKRKQLSRFVTSAAACLALVVCAVVALPTLFDNMPNPDNPGIVSGEQPGETSSPGEQTTPEKPGTAVPVVHMNTVSVRSGAARPYFPPNETYRETWDWVRAIQYLGKDITPDYLMPGLKTNPWIDRQAEVVFNNNGTLAYDEVWLSYFTDFPYKDGSQAIGGNSTGIQITASKIGCRPDCIVVWGEDMKESNLNGVAVKFGHSEVGYGGTLENPDFYYDAYVAEFSKDGIYYYVGSSNISEVEFVKMVDSLTGK